MEAKKGCEVKIHKLCLRNFGCHADREVELDDGFTGLLGPNGSGKSTLIDAMRFALADKLPAGSVQNDQIRHGSEGPCFVELTGSHAGHAFFIKRQLRPSSQKLTIDDASYSSAADVREHLHSLLGVDGDYLDEHVLIGQKDLTRFIFLKDSERSALFSRLFGVAQMGKIYDGLGTVLSGVYYADYTQELQQCDDRLRSLQTEIDAQVLQIQTLQQGCSVDDLRRCDDRIAGYQAYHLDCRRLEFVTQHAASVDNVLDWPVEELFDTLGALVSTLQEQFQTVARLRREIEDQLHRTEAVRSKQQEYQTTLARAGQLHEQLQALYRRLQQPPPPEYVVAESRTDPGLTTELHRTESLIRAVQQASDGRCPTCFSDVSHLREHLPQLQQAAAYLQQRQAALTHRVLVSEQYDAQLRSEHSTRLLLEQEFAWVQDRLRSLSDTTGQSVSTDDLVRRHAFLQAQEASLANQIQTLMHYVGEQKAQAASGTAMAAERAQLIEKIALFQPQEGEYEAALTRREQVRRALEDLAYRQGTLTEKQKQAQELQAHRDRLALQQEAGKRSRERLEVLQRTRALFHRQALPRDVAVAYRERLQDEINRALGYCGMTFQVHISNELHFRVTWIHGSEHDARRLSGGQQVVFALAFRLAVHTLFARDVGCLVLDEPTAGLDRDNLAVVRSAVSYLRRYLASSLQVVLVTHEPFLETMFDRVLWLG